MAQRLSEFTMNGKCRYNWESWEEPGSIWRLRHGYDFNCDIDIMRQQLYRRAARTGMSVKTESFDDTIVFQFSARDPVPEEVPV